MPEGASLPASTPETLHASYQPAPVRPRFVRARDPRRWSACRRCVPEARHVDAAGRTRGDRVTAPRGLLSRIAGTPPADEVEAIVAHLGALLGTWRGDAPSSPGFGLAAFVDLVHDLPKAADGMGAAIREAIEAYEPRLGNVMVRHIPDEGLVLRFQIEAELVSRRRPVKLSTAFQPGGRVEVRGR